MRFRRRGGRGRVRGRRSRRSRGRVRSRRRRVFKMNRAVRKRGLRIGFRM